jgi:PleD family two-component response regulator
VQFTISIGCCCVVPRPQDRHEAVLLAADARALPRQNEGRNRVCMTQTLAPCLKPLPSAERENQKQ